MEKRTRWFEELKNNMPQLDVLGFKYMLHVLSVSYLSIYSVVTLFLLKPIFREFFLFYTQSISVLLELMVILLLLESKVVLTKTRFWLPWWVFVPKVFRVPLVYGPYEMPWFCAFFGLSVLWALVF